MALTHFQPSFDDLSSPLFEVRFCVLDLETTGGSPATCEITEIGAVGFLGGEVTGRFQTLVDPGTPIPPSITYLTGITEAMVLDAPRIEVALPAFLEYLGDAVVVGHNVRFDLSFLNAAAVRLGYGRLANKAVDTAALSRRLIRGEVRNLKLQTLARHFRSPVTPNHRALEDASATAHVFFALLERVGSMGVTNLDDLLELPKARGSAHYSKLSLTDGLPRKPGVYLFRDRQGSVIYVGKTGNIRNRARQYFYGDERKSIGNLLRELDQIDHQVCDTVLEAEITELRLIHAHRPRYNRRSRPPKASHFVKLTDERFPRLSVVRAMRSDGLAYLGPYRSKRSADEVVAAIWDAVPIRRCATTAGSRSGKCAAAQLGVAGCPCDGRLEPADYRVVVDNLLSGLEDDPAIVLEPLRRRMQRLSSQLRYEEAGWARDRHDALARSIAARSAWKALVDAGTCRFEDRAGRSIVVDGGRYVGESRLLGPVIDSGVTPGTTREVPPSVETAEEAAIIWRWIERGDLRLVESTGVFEAPNRPETLSALVKHRRSSGSEEKAA